MANRPAPALVLRDGDRVELERLTRSWSVRAGLAQRARIVLLAAEGVTNTEIAERCRGDPADGDDLAAPLRRAGAGRAGGWPEAGPASADRPGADHHRDAGAAAEEAGRDALVDPAARRAAGGRQLHGRQGVAGVRDPALAARRRSGSPPTRNWRRRSSTSSGCTWTRRRTRSCCAWMSWVGLGRVDVLADVTFPQPARRTGRACLHASGSPRGRASGVMLMLVFCLPRVWRCCWPGSGSG